MALCSHGVMQPWRYAARMECSQDGRRLDSGALRPYSQTIWSRLPTRHRWLMRRPFLTMSIPTVSVML